MRSYSPARVPKRLQKPARLLAGDRVLLIAPASPPLQLDVIDRAVQAFTGRGFEVQVAKNARARHGFIAGSDRERLSDLNGALRSKHTKAIICVRGGYGTGRIIERADFAAMAGRPKILVGCSDITALHCASILYAKTISFHGPMPQSLVKADCPEFTWKSLIGTLSGDESSVGSIASGYPHAAETIDSLRKGRVTARLIGGNLAVLASLIGTRFFPSLEGSILFFEDIGETPFRMDRCLTQLLNTGLLQQAAGFALGLFMDCEYRAPKSGDPVEYRQTLRDVIRERLAPLGKPVVMGLPFGHFPHNATVPVGALATLDGSRGSLVIEEPSVS